MKAQQSIKDIPVVVEGRGRTANYHWPRRALQAATLVLALLIPLSGLFRIDPVAGAFVVLGRQIWFSDFYIVLGLWLAISCSLVMTYSLVGTAFCGWVCPQNTLAEWANNMTHKWLGKRADVSLDGVRMRVSAGKNKLINWVILGVLFLLVAMLSALVPLVYFYPPDVIWSFITFADDERLAGSLHWIYTIFVIIMLLNIAFIRHFWCRFMCIYKVWQHSFKTRETLRIAHDDSAREECERCNYCATVCFVGIDPRNTETFDSCINCGECINACDSIRASRGTGSSLLRFVLGQDGRIGKRERFLNIGTIFARARWALSLALLGLMMFVWGVWHYQPYHMTAYRADMQQPGAVREYRINIANKLYRRAQFTIEIDGLQPDQYQLARDRVSFDSTGRQNVALQISAGLSAGLHPFVVRIHEAGGWTGSFRVHHYAAGVHHNG